ncbi:aminoglycoside phosphotransferase family protein [Actinopolymorpha sp. B17G11]|uniref:aminoglycoside phosphotransferase family protein n=1 Tax=Actinopolymorpha sp. B17G11 TaxID=3160861 RepID=UPI0032E41241
MGADSQERQQRVSASLVREALAQGLGDTTDRLPDTSEACHGVLADKYGLDAPRLIASDLDGEHTGQVATLETLLPGSRALPPAVSDERLEAAGAAIAKVHAIPLTPEHHLPYRPRPIAVDDFAGDRRAGRIPTTALLQLADERVRAIGTPSQESVFVHGDVWGGNMLWAADICVALIDWKTAGAGDPGVDLGELRKQMALQYGPDAPAHVLNGWQRQAGRTAVNVACRDAVAALNTPTVLDGWPGFAENGNPLDAAVVSARRDAFSKPRQTTCRPDVPSCHTCSADRQQRSLSDTAGGLGQGPVNNRRHLQERDS